MTIGTWFDILFDGMKQGIAWLMAIDIGGISLGNYIIVIFITGLLITLFLNVVNTGLIMGSNYAAARSRKESREAAREANRAMRRDVRYIRNNMRD